MIKNITSAANPLIKDIIKLKNDNALRKEKNLIIIEGEDLITLAYEHHLLDVVITSATPLYQDIDTYVVPPFILEKISSNKSTPQYMGIAHYAQVREIKGKRLIYLDNIQDPGNLGTILRTALAFSYDGLIINNRGVSPYNEKFIQASKGAIFGLPIYFEDDLSKIKNLGYQIVVTALKGAKDYREVSSNLAPMVLVLGNEGQGVQEKNMLLADWIIKIPMGNIDSLNVAIAGGILMNYFRD
jgi:TrmH family RNA methyltransferase